MKVSLNWLREYFEVPDDVSALSELLTFAGVEVEGIETRGVSFDKVVVAQILSSDPHPNADRLSVCKVEDGSDAPRQIVCGAKNYQIGDKVPLAQPGAILPGNFTIKTGKLRGVESQGMMCSAKELNLTDEAEGLLILPPDAEIGRSLKDLFPADTILEVEVTPNRPDLLSHIGMAREIAALARKPLRIPEPIRISESGEPSVEVRVEAPVDCSLYTARRIRGITVGPSPGWLRNRLEGLGLRSINSVVDITNLVMLETGQPLHAFDAAHIAGGILVRHARDGEEFLALDGKSYRLKETHLLICDFNKAVAIAGVMGGEHSGVTERTRDVILESAIFRPASIRRTSRELGLASDSSYRFERGVDPAGVNRASDRAAQLIADLTGGSVEKCAAAGDAPADEWDARFSRPVPLRSGRCAEVAGGDVPEKEVSEILTRLGLRREESGWRAPSFRPDLTREIDLVEEVIRVFGIDRIPSRVQGRYLPARKSDAVHDRCMQLRRDLVAIGFFEARTVSMVSQGAAETDPLRTDALRRIKNPLSEDQAILRPNLAPALLSVLEHNVRGGRHDLKLFELARVFRGEGTEERLHLALVITGMASRPWWRAAKPAVVDFFDLKGVIESLGLGPLEFARTERPGLALGAEIRTADAVIGVVGQLPPVRARELDLVAPVAIAEIDLSLLDLAAFRPLVYTGITRFPAVTRDIAMLTSIETPHAQIESALRSANEPLLERVELFDMFTDPSGEKIPADRKSLAYSLTYRANGRTLTTDEVGAAHGRLKERLKAAVEIEFRE